MKLRFFALAMALVMLFSRLPAAVSAAQSGNFGASGDNITWTFENGLLTISGYGEMAEVHDLWDENGSHLGTDAPWYGLGVTDVVVEQGVSNISAAAFAHIDTLQTVSLPDSLTVIDAGAFEGCTALESISLPPYLTDIRDNAFLGCESLSGTLEIPEMVSVIGYDAFRFTGLNEVVLPAAVEEIGDGAFSGCGALEFLLVDEGNGVYDSDDQGALYTEGRTELLQVPGSFYGTFTVPETVTMLYNELAFEGCAALETVVIPASVTEMVSYLFLGCPALVAIEVDENNPVYHDVDGILYGNVTTYDEDFNEVTVLSLMTCPAAKDVGDFTVPAGVGMLDAYCFAGAAGLTGITIPASCTEVYTGIFSGCTGLEAIRFEEGHPDYYSDAEGVVFNQDTVVTEYDPATCAMQEVPYAKGSILCFFPAGRTGFYEIPAGVTELAGGSFSGSRIEAVSFPAGFEKLSYWSMDGCESLSWLLFTGDKPDALDGSLEGVTAAIHYPEANVTWDDPRFDAALGKLTYVPYDPDDVPVWPGQEPGPDPVVDPFTDVPEDSFYFDPVLWAVENGITNGLSATEFGPNAVCNRAQVVTFLWRAAGEPEPAETVNPFVDVEAGSFYEKAVLWAVEKGITTGTDATHFSPNMSCNRATVVTFLHRAADAPTVENAENPFTDVPADSWYTTPVLWAVENGITNGLSADTFGPNESCNRAQVVTFLYRAYH